MSEKNLSCSGDTRNVSSFIEIQGRETEGKEKVKGTDVPVWKVVKAHLDGSTIEDILESYPDLSEEGVRGAISYYYCHRRRIGRQIDEESTDKQDC